MNRPVEFKTRPQLALESYLDALLQDATAEELPEPILVLEPAVEPESPLDEFQQAVMEEQARDAQVVEALQSQFPLLRDKAMDRTYLFEPHQYVEIARLREVMQDPHEVDQQGAPVLDASTGMPQSKYSELCVYTAKNIIERPGLLPSLERANGTRLFGPPHKEGWLSNKSLERWHEQDAARKAR